VKIFRKGILVRGVKSYYYRRALLLPTATDVNSYRRNFRLIWFCYVYLRRFPSNRLFWLVLWSPSVTKLTNFIYQLNFTFFKNFTDNSSSPTKQNSTDKILYKSGRGGPPPLYPLVGTPLNILVQLCCDWTKIARILQKITWVSHHYWYIL